jgi:hypothetical protein
MTLRDMGFCRRARLQRRLAAVARAQLGCALTRQIVVDAQRRAAHWAMAIFKLLSNFQPREFSRLMLPLTLHK